MTPAMNDASTANPLQSIDHVREQFHNLHEFVAVARARLDRNVWDYLIGAPRPRPRFGAIAWRSTRSRSARAFSATSTAPIPARRSSAARSPCRWRSPRSAASSGSTLPPARRSPTPPAPSAVPCSRARWPSPTSRNRQGRAERAENLSALRAWRPGLGRGDLRPRGQGRLRRALPHRRHSSLQPARARHLQALPRRFDAIRTLTPPEGARLGPRSTSARRSTSCRSSSRASPPPRTPSSRSSTAST